VEHTISRPPILYQVISTCDSQKRSSLVITNTASRTGATSSYITTIADQQVEHCKIFLLGGESLRDGNKSQPPTDRIIDQVGTYQAPPWARKSLKRLDHLCLAPGLRILCLFSARGNGACISS
jgi:hypothetical protein